MIEFFAALVSVGLLAGVFTEVVEPAATYALDQGKAGYEYVEEKLN